MLLLAGAGFLSVGVLAEPASATATAITLSVDRTNSGMNEIVELTAVANGVPYPWRIVIFDVTLDRPVTYCATSESICIGDGYSEGRSGNHMYRAVVGRYSSTYTGRIDAQFESLPVNVYWWDVTLSASQENPFITTPVGLLATANQAVDVAGFELVITEGDVALTSCTNGATCFTAVSHIIPGCHTYSAYIYDDGGWLIAADSVQVCWKLI